MDKHIIQDLAEHCLYSVINFSCNQVEPCLGIKIERNNDHPQHNFMADLLDNLNGYLFMYRELIGLDDDKAVQALSQAIRNMKLFCGDDCYLYFPEIHYIKESHF